jgi:hypothetical protein
MGERPILAVPVSKHPQVDASPAHPRQTRPHDWIQRPEPAPPS